MSAINGPTGFASAETPNTPAFMLACNAAIEALRMPHEHARRPNGRVILPGSLAAIAAKYFGAKDFQRLDLTSQSNRRNIIESCLQEKINSDQLGDMPAKLFSGSHMKWLMEPKEDLPAAANNRRKYFSAMLGWAVHAIAAIGFPQRRPRCEGHQIQDGRFLYLVGRRRCQIRGASPGRQQGAARAGPVALHRLAPFGCHPCRPAERPQWVY